MMEQNQEDIKLQDTFNRKTAAQTKAPTDDTLSWKFIWEIIITHKLWIVISVVVAMTLAWLHIKRATPQYSRYTTLLVKEQRKSSQMSAVSDQIANMGLFNSASNVNNDIQALKSPYLMYLVIKKLNLNVSYAEPHFFRNYDLYGQSPITAEFPDSPEEQNLSMKVTVKGPSDYELSNFTYVDAKTKEAVKDEKTKVEAHAFQKVHTPMGTVMIAPNTFAPSDSGRVVLVNKVNANKLAEAYVGALNVELADKLASVINITYNDVSAQKAEDVLNAMYDLYVQEQIDKKKKTAAITSKFIDERLMIIEKELGNIDQDIEQYKTGQLLTDVAAEGMNALGESNRYSQQSLNIYNQLEVAKYIKDCLTTTINGKPTMLPSNAGLSESGVARQIEEYNEMVMRRDKLIANSSERNPLVAEIDRNMKNMQSSITNSLSNLIHSYTLQIQSLKGKESQIQSKIAKNPKQEKYLQTVGRQQKIKESLYLFLLQKREENELSGTIEAYNIDVVTPPRGSDKPISPDKKKIMLMALIIGFGLPVFIFWLLDTMDDTVRGKKDLSGLTMPFLGTIPLTEQIKDDQKGPMPVRVVVEEHNRNVVNESFRVLRSNFSFMAEETGTKIIMFTSYFPNSGKTFLSTNLGLALALIGKKILIVDLDMRKAELSKAFADKRAGVSSYLSGHSKNLEENIVVSKLNPNLSILPCGVIPPNPAELLLKPELSNMFAELRDKYDYIFVDSTPLNIVADAATIGKHADLVVFSIREGNFLREALPDLEKLFQSGVFKRMATVLNGSVSGSGYGRYHRYGSYGRYGRYGKYGYGDEYKAYGEKK